VARGQLSYKELKVLDCGCGSYATLLVPKKGLMALRHGLGVGLYAHVGTLCEKERKNIKKRAKFV